MLTCPDCGEVVELSINVAAEEAIAFCTVCSNTWNDLGQRTNKWGEPL